MHTLLPRAHALAIHCVAAVRAAGRARDERGEGVISTAIAVLIVAFLGVAAYALFSGLLTQAGNGASAQLRTYGG